MPPPPFLEPHMKGRPHRVPPLDRALAISAYATGMLVTEIAQVLLRNEDVIYRILKQAGYGKTKPWNKPRCHDARLAKSLKRQTLLAQKPKGPWPKRKRQLRPRDPLLDQLRTQSTLRTTASTRAASSALKL